MTYHAPTNQFTITQKDLAMASHSMRWAICNIRRGAGLDLKGYKIEGPMGEAHFAEAAVLDAARDLAINLGAERPGKLDVSDAG